MAENKYDIDDAQELDIETEEDETPFVEFDISASPSDLSLEMFSYKLDDGDILIPFYQRKYVWKIEQASRLIESFLMGLPVPQVFLYINDEAKLEVIDGQQRIKSVNFFFKGYFGEPDARGRHQVFKLKGLSERSEYNGKTFEDLSDRDKRRLKNATLRAINIKQLKPTITNDSVFHIFERLNTGGTRLKAQEIRNAVYRGAIVGELESLNRISEWRSVIGMAVEDQSQKDLELVLRLFSLFRVWENYQKPMLAYLNHSMASDRGFGSARAKEFKAEFPRACELVRNALQRPFRPRGVLNAAVLEAVMITLLEDPSITAEQLSSRYPKLENDEEFQRYIRGATTDTGVLIARLKIAQKLLTNAA